jgi:hypothetical protein
MLKAKNRTVKRGMSLTLAFSLSDLHRACPGVSVDLIRTVLKRLKGKSVECLGRATPQNGGKQPNRYYPFNRVVN